MGRHCCPSRATLVGAAASREITGLHQSHESHPIDAGRGLHKVLNEQAERMDTSDRCSSRLKNILPRKGRPHMGLD
jgi:hypothetical protein